MSEKRSVCSVLALVVCGAGCSSGGNGGKGGNGAGSGDGGLVHVDRSHLADAGTSGSLDYSDPALWVCRPGIDPNPCHGNLDATELLPDGGRQVVAHQRAEDPKFDCFYVYPTVDLTTNGNMTNLSDVSLMLDPVMAQAARFSRLCEVYAPLYRQVAFTPSSIASPASGGDGGASGDGGSAGGGAAGGAGDAGGSAAADAGAPSLASAPGGALALQDVRDAFRYYLQHDNGGRKFVIMGHSQGTIMLSLMMQTDVDPVPDVRARMISALLIGGGVTVAPGQAAGGTFKNIPLCAKPGDTGCVIAYSSFDVAS